MKNVWLYLLLVLLTKPLFGNIIGNDLQNFNPSLSVTDLATVHSSRTIGQGRFGLGIFINSATNTLPYFDNSVTSNRDANKKLNDTVTGTDVQLTYGVLSNWDLNITIPSVISQSIRNEDAPHGYFADLGNTELRFSTKVEILDAKAFHLGLVGTGSYNNIQGNPYTGNVKWPSVSLELVLGTEVGPVEWSVNLGHRWRHTEDPSLQEMQDLPIKSFGDQWLASTGVAIDLPSTDWDLISEVYGAQNREDFSDESPRGKTIAEGLLGVRRNFWKNFQFHAGLGAELTHSVSTADYRVYAGIRWVIGKKEEKTPVTVAPVQPKIIVQEKLRQPDAIIEWDDVYFQFDSTKIRDPKAYENMANLKKALDAQPIEKVVVQGYTCNLGSDDYNLALSSRRAHSIEQMLIHDYGIASNKLSSIGWGEQFPKASNATRPGRVMNRRVNFKIYYRQPLVRDTTELKSAPAS